MFKSSRFWMRCRNSKIADTTHDLHCRSVPTVLRVRGYRFHFWSNEGREPPHIHVKAGEHEAKFWLDPVQLVVNYGFNGRELTRIQLMVEEHQNDLLAAWEEHLGT